jgi:hypothetical protein
MYFIYSLSFNGVPFYVGKTINPITRLIAHKSNSQTSTYNIIRNNRINGIYPELNILYHTKSASVIKEKEKYFITEISKCYPLVNKGTNKNCIIVTEIKFKNCHLLDDKGFYDTSITNFTKYIIDKNIKFKLKKSYLRPPKK